MNGIDAVNRWEDCKTARRKAEASYVKAALALGPARFCLACARAIWPTPRAARHDYPLPAEYDAATEDDLPLTCRCLGCTCVHCNIKREAFR